MSYKLWFLLALLTCVLAPGTWEVAAMPEAGKPGEWEHYRRPALPAGVLPYRPYTLAPGDRGWISEGVWPSLYLDRSQVPEIRRKAAALPWARELIANMQREAELVLPLPPQIPVERCGWRHDFFSRSTGAHLYYEPEQADAFLDPTTGKREYDPAQRRAWALLTHERTYRLMNSLALLYQVTGDERYASWVAQGMRLAADYFAHPEFHTGEALFYSSLYDAGMLLLLAGAYDLTRDSPAYTRADHERIRTGIFEERIPSLLRYLGSAGTHNIACFAAAAVARSGQLLGREDWLQRGLEGKAGLRQQLEQGVPAVGGQVDGLWVEGTMFYHFYALCPLVTLYEIERQVRGAVDPELTRRLRAMLQAPVRLADAQWRLPTLGDLGCPSHMNLAAYRHLYEYGAGRLDPAGCGRVLAALYHSCGAPRTDWAALAWGPDELPGAMTTRRHSLLPVAETGVFRQGDWWLLFRAGRYRGGHDHPDRLSVFLHAGGRMVSADLGEPGYALRGAHHNWYRSTLAHNTLFADEQDLGGEARLDWRPQATIPCARGTVTSGGVTFGRTVFFDPPLVVLVDECEARGVHRLGWAFHAAGTVSGKLDPPRADLELPALPDEGVWSNLVGRRTGSCSKVCNLTWEMGDGLGLRLLSASDRPREVTLAEAPGNPFPNRQGVVVMRTLGSRWVMCTVLETAQRGHWLCSGISPLPDGARVQMADGSIREYRWKQGKGS